MAVSSLPPAAKIPPYGSGTSRPGAGASSGIGFSVQAPPPSEDSAIRLWDIASGRGRELRDRIFGASSAAFSADSRFLVAAVQTGIFGAWRLNLWDLRRPANPPRTFGEGSSTVAA